MAKRDDNATMTVPCPRCGEPAEFSPRNRYRPFCSKRCKLIDLGAWANDEYSIPGDPLESDEMSEAATTQPPANWSPPEQ